MAEYERVCPSYSFPDDMGKMTYKFQPQNSKKGFNETECSPTVRAVR
jgi:hypothetical protein